MSSALNTVPLNFLRFISSETYQVVAESGEKHFFVHSGVIAARSESLFNMQGLMPKEIDLSKWDGDTVGRLVEFLYIGNYQPPESTVDGCNVIEKLWAKARKIEAEGEADSLDTAQILAGQEDSGSSDTGVNLLLVHAKVYALAQYSCIEELQVMALKRLGLDLGEIDGRISNENPKMAVDVVGLLKYVCSYINSPDAKPTPEKPVQELLSTFAAQNFEGLMCCREMELFLGEGGNFAIDIMGKVAKRLFAAGKCFEAEEKLRIIEGKVQDWKNEAAASLEKTLQLEATNAANLKKLDSTMLQLEIFNRIVSGSSVAFNSKRTQRVLADFQELEAVNALTVANLKIANEEIKKLQDRIIFLENMGGEVELVDLVEDSAPFIPADL